MSRRKGPGLFGILIGAVAIYFIFSFLFFSLTGIYGILQKVAPFLFVATMFINFGVIKDYVQLIGEKFKSSFFTGLLYGVGSLILFPFLSAFLFYKAIKSDDKKSRQDRRNKKRSKRKKDDEYIDFEELNEEESPLDFKEMRDKRKSYEELYEEKSLERE